MPFAQQSTPKLSIAMLAKSQWPMAKGCLCHRF
jgi:hypothetical protein